MSGWTIDRSVHVDSRDGSGGKMGMIGIVILRCGLEL